MKKGYLELECVTEIELAMILQEFESNGSKYVFECSEPWESEAGPLYDNVCFFGEIPDLYEDAMTDGSNLDYYECLEEEWNSKFA